MEYPKAGVHSMCSSDNELIGGVDKIIDKTEL